MSDRYQVSIAARLERLPLTGYQRTLFLIIATAWLFDSIDLGSLTFVLGSIRSDFGLSAAQTGLLSSMSFVGMFLGAAIAGIAADRYGRTLVFQASMIFWGAGGIACGLAPSVTALGADRALLGFGMGMEFPVAQSIVSEIIPARVRAVEQAAVSRFPFLELWSGATRSVRSLPAILYRRCHSPSIDQRSRNIDGFKP